MALVDTLKKNKAEMSALFLSGKQTEVYSSTSGCTNDLTLVSYVPARKKMSSFHHSAMKTHTWARKEITNLKLSCTTYNATKSGNDILDKLVREYTCTRSTSSRNLELFPRLIAATCVSAFILWMLKS